MIKRLLNYLPDWLVKGILLLIFIVSWPFLLVFVGTKALFSSQSTTQEKISGAKVALVTAIVLILVGIYFANEHYLRPFYRYLDQHGLAVFLVVMASLMLAGLIWGKRPHAQE